jgi:hypothetical protein
MSLVAGNSNDEFTLVYQGVEQRMVIPGRTTGGTWHVWALSYNGEYWTSLKDTGDAAEARVTTMAAVRISMNTDHQVSGWERVDRVDDVREFRAVLAGNDDVNATAAPDISGRS